ncbi:MAG TPA: alpha/beta hydrolase [Nannocystaceae bacterium]|nr:alpha/beta hydrolase [Nannocystaceae bacterium]
MERETFTVVAAGARLEAAWIGPHAPGPTLVLLHEGLGCIRMWRDWPDDLVRATGLRALAFSRAGYGNSDPIERPRPLDYMEREGESVLPEVLDAAGIHDAILVGHSDGATIALVHAGTAASRPRVRGVVALAPHVFCEDCSVAAIRVAKDAWLHGDLRERLRKHHGDNVEHAFWGWNDAWLDPRFRAWNVERYLPAIEIPIALVQGADDEYGTLRQLDAIAAGVRGPVTRTVLAECGHSPHRDRPTETTAVVAELVASLRLR